MAKNFPCPGCGADLEWSPGAGNLTCPYCGHFHEDTSVIPDFTPQKKFIAQVDSYKRESTPWGTETKQMDCGSCGANFDVEPTVENSACPFCGSAAINPHKGSSWAMIPADGVAPFSVSKEDAARSFREWLGGLWFRPSALKTMAQLGSLQGSYIPVWTFDVKTDAKWEAERGTYYYEEEEVEDDQGNTTTKRVRKTSWEDASGRHTGKWQDVMVNASKAIDQELLEGLLPYNMNKMRPYDVSYLQGFVGERYQVPLEEGYEGAQKIVEDWVEKKCAEQVGGDTHRNLDVETRFLDPKFALVLAPVWIAAYQYNGESYRYVVNGQTGKAHGTSPLSWPKIIGLILAIVAVIAGIVIAAQSG
ncbi:MAG: TFIIB-type zinc ribbon-containing protein [Alphaproteobacteria bacterium]|nr:TFIIB-type zinc ribbon-containing protein [Alphaproteobacteria bacterium]